MNDPNVWASFFDEHAPKYEENCFTKNTPAEVDFLMRELGLDPGAAILDVGCGTGRHAIAPAGRGFAVTGLDVSEGMLNEARRNAKAAGVRIEWIKADATAFCLPERFDAVICLCEGSFGLLGAGDDPIRHPLAILTNVSGAMKPGARRLFTVLNGFRSARKHSNEAVAQGLFDPVTLSEPADFPPGLVGPPGLRERGFVPTELVLLFSAAGLEVLHIWGGTAGNWGKRAIDLDEYELMVSAKKVGRPVQAVP
jgi:cyclopropane fatty-acyl-phospholipid synthase-like methyltransferase